MEILYWVLGIIGYIAMGQLTYIIVCKIDKGFKKDDDTQSICGVFWPVVIIIGSVFLIGKFFYLLFTGGLFKSKKNKCCSRIEALEEKLELQELKEENEQLKKEWEELGFEGELVFMGINTISLKPYEGYFSKRDVRAIMRYLREFGE